MNTNKIWWQKLDEIHHSLLKEYKNEPNVGGLVGVSGMALFEFYYAQLKNDDQYAELGLEMLSHSMDMINNGYGMPSFAQGIAGMGWTMDHLSLEGFLDDDNDDLLTAFDEYLMLAMTNALDQANFDYLHGAIGYGMYFHNRYKNTKNNKLKVQYIENLRYLLKGLDSLAERDGDGLKWKSDIAKNDRPPCYDLSHAHGLSGIINFLCRIYEITELKDEINPLLEGGLSFIKRHKTNDKDAISLFPSQIFDNTDLKYNSRVGWCYGDLGPAMAFSRAGKTLGRSEYELLSQELFKNEAKKRDPKITYTIDSGFCHGSFGTAQVFKRVQEELPNPQFEESHKFWILDGFHKGNNTGSPAGFKQYNGRSEKWEDVYSVLEGVSGIGLVMIDHLSDKKLNWDQIFMIS